MVYVLSTQPLNDVRFVYEYYKLEKSLASRTQSTIAQFQAFCVRCTRRCQTNRFIIQTAAPIIRFWISASDKTLTVPGTIIARKFLMLLSGGRLSWWCCVLCKCISVYVHYIIRIWQVAHSIHVDFGRQAIEIGGCVDSILQIHIYEYICELSDGKHVWSTSLLCARALTALSNILFGSREFCVAGEDEWRSAFAGRDCREWSVYTRTSI